MFDRIIARLPRARATPTRVRDEVGEVAALSVPPEPVAELGRIRLKMPQIFVVQESLTTRGN